MERRQRPGQRAGGALHRGRERGEGRPRPARRASSSPQMRPSRISTEASIELPEGIGSSSTSFGRVASSSPSRGARKKPPRSSSANRTTATSAIRRASRSHRGSPVATWSARSPCATFAWSSRNPGPLDPALADAAHDAAVVASERAEEELAEPLGRREPVGAVEAARRLGERRQREAVPRGDRLVVAQRLRPLSHGSRAGAPDPRPRACRGRWSGRARTARAVLVEAQLPPLVRLPRVRETLDPVGVRVLGGGEPALSGGAAPAGGSRRSPRRPRGSAPRRSRPTHGGTRRRAARCRRASSRSAARATGRRPSSDGSRRRRRRRGRRRPSRRACPAPSRGPAGRRGEGAARSRTTGGNFGARAEAAERRLVDPREPGLGRVEQRRRQLLVAGLEPRGAAERGHQALGLLLELVAALAPRVGDGAQNLGECAACRAAARAGSTSPRRTACRPGS